MTRLFLSTIELEYGSLQGSCRSVLCVSVLSHALSMHAFAVALVSCSVLVEKDLVTCFRLVYRALSIQKNTIS